MKVALVAMPWQPASRPSVAIGALRAFINQEEPSLEIDSRYEYLRLASNLGYFTYQEIARKAAEVGEVFYASLLYPERRNITESWARTKLAESSRGKRGISEWDSLVQKIYRGIEEHLEQVVADVSEDCDILALTTTYYEIFPSILLAERVKERAPGIKVVLGGATLSGNIGTSLMREYPFLDFIVQGEGELPFLTLLRGLRDSALVNLEGVKGLLTRTNFERLPQGATVWGVPKVDALPLPNYDGYNDFAGKMGYHWELPIEGSRGCWWDRVKKTGDIKDTCYFCSLNAVFDGYREKTVSRLCQDVENLTDKYGNLTITFVDNIVRSKGVEELAAGLKGLNREIEFVYEMRANISPYEILCLSEAGLTNVQFGIEGLSTSYLKRIGKGTATIQNLQAMKTCKELNIFHHGNLIVSFPGSTEDEVSETCTNIRKYCYGYQPLRCSPFMVQAGTTVEALAAQFSVRKVRNADYFAVGLPLDVYERLVLFDKSFETSGQTANWAPVVTALDHWWNIYWSNRSGRMPMDYLDAGKFLLIRYYRQESGEYKTLRLNEAERDLYLFCAEIKNLRQIESKFGSRISLASLEQLLGSWFQEAILFVEAGKYLSLAPANTPQNAARRIRNAHAEREPERKKSAQPLTRVAVTVTHSSDLLI